MTYTCELGGQRIVLLPLLAMDKSVEDIMEWKQADSW